MEGKHTHLKTFSAIVLTLGLLAVSGFAQPAITGVQNAASNALTPLPNSSIALGSYFAVYGTGFGPSTPALWNPYPLPTSLGGTSASVAVPAGGTPVAAYIEFAANFGTYSQINAVLPSNTPTGPGTVTITYNGATSATFPVTVVTSSFGTFSLNEAGTGPGIITDVNYNVLTPFHTAKPGDYVILWGTGLGPAPDVSTEATAPPTTVDFCPAVATCPTVWVAGQSANIYYAGRSSYTAEDQIIFQVPPGVQGCYVQVALQTGSVIGNFTSMTVDPNGATCQDADGVNYNDIASTVSSNGKANVGALSLLSNYLNLDLTAIGIGTVEWDNDTVSGEIATFTTGQLGTFQGFALAPSVNNCTVSPFLAYPPPTDPVLSQLAYLDAGAALSIQGPSGSPQPVTKNTNGKGYSGLVGGSSIKNLLLGQGIDPFFLNSTGWGSSSWTYGIVPGTFTVTGPGGANVGALSASITVPSSVQQFNWTNEASVTGSPIPRNTPLTITWSGGDPEGFVDITAVSSTLQSGLTPSATTPGILVECIAPASTGSFAIPTYVLESLPSTAGSAASIPPGELLVGPASVTCGSSSANDSAACASAVKPPSGLDALYVFYHFIAGQNVTWQ
jgi:uncharacterized protein (TIGR03437 family)